MNNFVLSFTNEIANPKMKPVTSRVTLRNFKPKKHRNIPKVNIIATHIHLLLLRNSQREDRSIVGQPNGKYNKGRMKKMEF